MRFEGKNLETKYVTHNSRSRVNISCSIMRRHAFTLARNLFLLRKPAPNILSKCCSVKNENIHQWVIYQNRRYSVGDFICIFDTNNVIPQFSKIISIRIHEDDIILDALPYETKDYNDHLCAYEVANGEFDISIHHHPSATSSALIPYIIEGNYFIPNTGIWEN